MSSDHPEDPDGPPDGRDDHDGEGTRASRPGGTPAETRGRQEYYTDLRITVSAEQTAATQQTSAKEQAAAEQWQEKSAESRWMWQEYQRKWPPTHRTPADRPGDQTSSRGTRAESLDAAANARVESECDRIADRERDKISPALRATESQDPDRQLIGFEHRLKGRDRIKEKVTGASKTLAVLQSRLFRMCLMRSGTPFSIRKARYTQGVWGDIGRLKEQGFELHKLKNLWSEDQYKGLNSQWIDRDTGQRFEVQFHTRISFEAKQLTHDAYKRLRAGQADKADKFEQMVLEAFQRKVTARRTGSARRHRDS